ncbi:hypothetical protein [Streptomyces albipurpureus]|uniref:Uncharacterized protein n=1 Tax=Streptomyces albipurpureus TaxID=2897419 RepID=A0ABT0URF4_9ACTN|nr:hypothetical protein [Streptomyces sp. CWNU-1]MCM2391019.1 hypothetical protein [Streptomyces sp. CWNU-1]
MGQLLLLIALLFGIATMHTVGHPTQSGSPPHTAASTGHPADGYTRPGAGHPPAQTAEAQTAAARTVQTPTVETRTSETRTVGARTVEAASVPRAHGTAPTSTAAAPHTSTALASAELTSTAPASTGFTATTPASAEPISTVTAAAGLGGPEVAVTSGHGPAGLTSGPDTHGDDHGMNPSMVCLAVLGAWGIVLVLTGGWWGSTRGARLPVLGAGVRIRRTLRPNPPPPRSLLAQLSVLRT